MTVYRITLAEFSGHLYASGRPARWNSKGTFVIYSASSRALACLENLVHRGGEGLDLLYRTMVIYIPDNIEMDEITRDELPLKWQAYKGQLQTRRLGDEWARSSAVLKVPSAIIPEENNYLINPGHLDFPLIQLDGVEKFMFDQRL